MPKTKVAPRPPDDVPIWDELVAELGDPRPYEPITIPSSYVVPDDAFDPERLDYEAEWLELDREVDDATSDLDDVERDAYIALDVIYTSMDESTVVVSSTDGTVFASIVGSLDVEQTLVLPVWPSTAGEVTS